MERYGVYQEPRPAFGWRRGAGVLSEVVKQAQAKDLTSDEHFTVDGTLIEAWASLKSFQRKDQDKTPPDDTGNPTVDFHGEKRSNETHESTTERAIGAQGEWATLRTNTAMLADTTCRKPR